MSNQKRKKNHWVPASYLKWFAADGQRQKIWRFSKNTGDPELKPIKKVAVKYYLYTPRDSSGTRDYSFEAKLSSLENLFGDGSFWQLLAEDFVDLNSESIRKGISLLAAVMFVRNPLYLQKYKDIHKQMVKYYSGFAATFNPIETMEINGKIFELDTSDWEKYRQADEDDIRRMWIDEIKTVGWLTKLFMNMRFAMLVTEDPMFITNDNPVFMQHPSKKFYGFNTQGTIVIFPVSSTRVLSFDNRAEIGNDYYQAVSPPAINYLIWRNSIEYMFSPRHPDAVCEEMAADAKAHSL